MSEKSSRSDIVYSYTAGKIEYLMSIADTGAGRGIMASLRHGMGRKPGELPELWGIIFDRIPDELIGQREPSYAEWAVYTALTLYALHQQGNEFNANAQNVSVGSAAARLIKKDEDMKRIINRLNLVITSVSPEDLAYHLRGIIQLLKSENIPLDYAQLAKELYLFHNQDYAGNIKLSWGRDFYSLHNELTENDLQKGEDE